MGTLYRHAEAYTLHSQQEVNMALYLTIPLVWGRLCVVEHYPDRIQMQLQLLGSTLHALCQSPNHSGSK